jgi:hypothetical protein
MGYTGDQKRNYQRKWLATRREKAIAFLGGECVVCGSTDGLEFDHKDRSEKEYHVGAMLSRKWDVLLTELCKCQLLCYTHHKEKTKQELTKKIHGTRTMYMRHDCRCDECTQAASVHREKYRV